MNRSLWWAFVVFFAVVGFSLVGDQPQAKAGWWHRAYWGGWYGGYGYYGHVGYYGYGYGYGYAAPVGCLGWTGCYTYPAYYGCCGWWGCCGCGYLPAICGCYGYVDCCGEVGTVIDDGKAGSPGPAQNDSVLPEQPTPAPGPAAEPAAPAEETSAYLNLRVPADATVVINQHTTTSQGETRRYVSRGLQPDREYRFEVTAQVTRDGRTLARSQVVRVKASDTADLVFDFAAPQMVTVSNVQ